MAAAVLSGCAGQSAPFATPTARAGVAPRAVLAPTGRLRVAVYRGSPSSFVQSAAESTPHGVAVDLGTALARALDVPVEPVVFARNAEALAAVADGAADVTFTNASPERARRMDFSTIVLDVEKSVLVTPAVEVRALADARAVPLRIGITAGSSTAEEFAPLFPKARLVPVATLQEAAAMLRDGRLDGYATNDAILFELGDQVPGSRVLAGRWGLEHFAIGIPHGRRDALPFLDAFVRRAAADGTLRAAIDRAGLRGVAPR